MNGEMAKTGRPPISGGRATLDVMLRVRILHSEKADWKRAAKKAGKSVSEWLRELANREAAQP